MDVSRSETRGASQWVDAAFARFAYDGLGAVRIEPLAKELGTTKGSFYWHFASRAELIAAVMQRWAERETMLTMEIAEQSGGADERLKALFGALASRSASRQGEATLYVEAQTEGVTAVVDRVSRQRIDYIADLLVELGFERMEAQRRGAISLAMVLGLLQLGTGTSGSLAIARDPELTQTAYEMALAR